LQVDAPMSLHRTALSQHAGQTSQRIAPRPPPDIELAIPDRDRQIDQLAQ
jgi:hypothetical protein